jgi:hypothetical protein
VLRIYALSSGGRLPKFWCDFFRTGILTDELFVRNFVTPRIRTCSHKAENQNTGFRTNVVCPRG